MGDPNRLQTYLRKLSMGAAAGEKLPTFRQLMQDFSLSQSAVQRVFEALRAEGLIVSQVGRGTFFTGGAEAPASDFERSRNSGTGRSVILLRRPLQNQRGRLVLDRLQQALSNHGDVTLEVAYSDPDHARQVLQTLPRFDACIVQNSFDIMPIDMIAAIRRRTDTVIVDGAWLVGTDIDAVGFEWGEPVERAVQLLAETGHERIVLATTANAFLANEMGLHRYRSMRSRPGIGDRLSQELRIPHLPPQAYEEAVVAALVEAGMLEGAQRTGLIVWGIESGQRFKTLLQRAGARVPEDVSVVLLGRTDIAEESAGLFHTIGYRAEQQADAVFARLLDRWERPNRPFELGLLPVEELAGPSIKITTGDPAG
ncbi:substrate-binding domain-containing protein [Devosia sp. SL43]|uniref:substrate-binding domain-containing protein n=1 Tax=Devosia sp. SL43 TaxID=2806348 RepID=UPI001F42BD72|nr:substrate-binding domain-containing protein [Devosia sp. SL43]UJW84862.1 substrate-binding domain-containing protein [Devosia sp. SL43]